MSIQYYLYSSQLPSVAGKYIAQTLSQGSVGIDDLARDIAQAGLAASQNEVKNIISQACELIEQHLTAGRRVQLGGIVNMAVSVRGTFDTPSSPFESTAHSIEVTASAGARLRKAIGDNARLQRVNKPTIVPDLQMFKDINNDSINHNISPNSIGQLGGVNLSFDSDDPLQGLFIVNALDASETKVALLQKASDKEIVFGVPDAIGTMAEVYLRLKRKNSKTAEIVSGKSVNLSVK